LRIARIAALYEGIPAEFYGGTERVVSYDELVWRGYEVSTVRVGRPSDQRRICSRVVLNSSALPLVAEQDSGSCLQFPMIVR